MRRLITPIALATSLIAAGSLAGASADPRPSSGTTAGVRAADHPTADRTTDPKAGQAIDWTSVAPEDPGPADDIGGGVDEAIPALPAAPRLITVVGHGTTVTAALDDAAETAKLIAHHEDLSLGDIQAITQQADAPPVATPDTTSTTTTTPATPATTPSTGLPATTDETVTVAYAIN